jgi:hypothetical protein
MSIEGPPPLPPADGLALALGESCPRCQQPLIDPAGLGWCKACGYCRTLQAERDNALLQKRPEPSRGDMLSKAARGIPQWFWILIGGIGVLAGMALAAGYLLPPGNCLPRAVWTSVQIPLGLLVVFAAQLYAVMRVAPDDERMSFKDALVPTRLWVLVAKRLPELSGCVCTAAWGASLALFAVLFIGGLGHWFTYLPGANKPPDQKAAQKDAKTRR